MKEKIKFILLMIIAILLVLESGKIIYNFVNKSNEEIKYPVATFEIQDFGNIKIELYPQYAPNTVANFITLINSGFYNNKFIYGKDDICLYMANDKSEDVKYPKMSLIDDSIEPDSDEDYEYEINGEFVANKFDDNTLRHEKGIVSLNRSDYSSYGLTEEGYNSGCFRFSVMMQDAPGLNGIYAGFGKVIEGLDILENIYNNQTIVSNEDEENTSAMKEFEHMRVITNASVETYGEIYNKPVVHKKFDIQSYINSLYSQYLSY